jgi:hypothetical protein
MSGSVVSPLLYQLSYLAKRWDYMQISQNWQDVRYLAQMINTGLLPARSLLPNMR